MQKLLVFSFIIAIALNAVVEVPVFYTKLDGNLNNEQKPESPGTANGPVLTEDRFGNADMAYQFDGVDDYLSWDFYDEIDISLSDFTISFWFKPTVLNKAMRIIDHGSTSALNVGDPHVPGWMVRTDNTNKIHIEIANKVAPNNLFMALTTTAGLTVNEWTQIYVVVERAVGIECFFNGVSAGVLNQDSTGISIGNGRGFNLGYNSEKNNEFFEGILDEVKIFGVKVTQDQIISEIDNCDSNCLTCQGTTVTCVTCVDRKYLKGDDTCGDCSSNCKTCVDTPDKCLTCEDYQFKTGSDTCDYCESNCKTCSGTADHCDTCIAGKFLTLTNTCLACNPDCKTCEDSKEKCTSCFGTKIVTLQNTCVECSDNCYKCEDVYNKCTSCKGSQILLSDFTCKDETCDQKCNGCQEDNDSQCILCAGGEGRVDSPPDCICQQGYYDIGNKDCEMCPSECQECNNKGQCTICKLSGMDIEQQCKRSAIVEGVTPSFSLFNPETNTYSEEICSPLCSSCQDTAENCILCKADLNRQFNAPLCSCMDGFYDNGSDVACQACPAGCLICTGQNGNCISHSTECSEGQFYDQDELICIECFYFQEVCIKSCPLNTEIKGQDCVIPEGIESQIMLALYAVGGLFFVGIIFFIVVSYKTNKLKQVGNQFQNLQQDKINNNETNNNNMTNNQPEIESQINL